MNEQTGAHQDAALNYEQAWKYSRKNQPTIGIKFQWMNHILILFESRL